MVRTAWLNDASSKYIQSHTPARDAKTPKLSTDTMLSNRSADRAPRAVGQPFHVSSASLGTSVAVTLKLMPDATSDIGKNESTPGCANAIRNTYSTAPMNAGNQNAAVHAIASKRTDFITLPR
jgi:hypothetical protein